MGYQSRQTRGAAQRAAVQSFSATAGCIRGLSTTPEKHKDTDWNHGGILVYFHAGIQEGPKGWLQVPNKVLRKGLLQSKSGRDFVRAVNPFPSRSPVAARMYAGRAWPIQFQFVSVFPPFPHLSLANRGDGSLAEGMCRHLISAGLVPARGARASVSTQMA